MSLRSRVERARFEARRLLHRGRLPNALILGAAKAGTSSLFAYLAEHPLICTPVHKELRFFDNRWDRGVHWYRASFEPARGQRVFLEASPMYLPHPLAPERARAVVPDAKLIVLLREPIARAYSEHAMRVRQGFESLPFTDALLHERDRLLGADEAIRRGGVHRPFNRLAYAYRSTYAPQIRRWMAVYPEDRFLFIKAEELFAEPAMVTNRVLAFLGLSENPDVDFRPHNQHGYPPIEEAALAMLRSTFLESNAEVKSLTGIGWT